MCRNIISYEMGVTRRVLKEGNKVDKPNAGDEIVVSYTANLYDESKGACVDFRGKE